MVMVGMRPPRGKGLEGRGEISSGKRLVRIPLLLRSKASLTHIHTLTHSLGWGRWLRWGWGLEELLLKQLLIRKSIPGCASFPHEHQFPHRCFITLRCLQKCKLSTWGVNIQAKQCNFLVNLLSVSSSGGDSGLTQRG